MIVKTFQPRFAPLVEKGLKLQTIRPTPKRMPKVGQRISLREWTDRPYRSKQRVLAEGTIWFVAPIRIGETSLEFFGGVVPSQARDDFAKLDGFKDWADLTDWFAKTHGLPFEGILIKWKP